MYLFVAGGTEGDQVLFGVSTAMAAKFFVVDLKLAPRAAHLTSPPVAAQHPLSQFFIRVGFQPQANRFRLNPVHDTFSLIC